MAEDRKQKRTYETPIVLDLGALTHGTGQIQCGSGSIADFSGNWGCKKGAVASCITSPPTACCRSGGTPTPLAESGNLSGEGQGFDDGAGSSGEGSGFRNP